MPLSKAKDRARKKNFQPNSNLNENTKLAEKMLPIQKQAFNIANSNLREYPAILYALTDPEKRVKIEKIYQSLKEFKQAENVYYGCGSHSVPFDVVGQLLEVTR